MLSLARLANNPKPGHSVTVYLIVSATLGWSKIANVRCGTGKWYKDQAKDKSKSYEANVAICAKMCEASKGKCYAFDISNKAYGKGGYCNIFVKEQCTKMGPNKNCE